MKKRILAFVLSCCLILPCAFFTSACNDGITDVAYVQVVPVNDGEYVHYTNNMYDHEFAHIYLLNDKEFENGGSYDDWEENYLLKVSFNRGGGIDEKIDDKLTFVAMIEGWYYMKISIAKEYYYTTPDGTTPKKVYLNGVDITSKAIQGELTKAPSEGSHALGTFWYDGVYYFEDCGLVKGNTSNYINKIEFK